MSRIDEAMKRASQGHHGGRAVTRTSDSSLRLAEDFTLNEYPLERAGAARVEAIIDEARIPAHEARAFRTPLQTEKPPSIILPDLERQAKLVVGASHDSVSTEQYRRLAASLHDVQVLRNVKTVMVTSALPREGKTLTTLNLALTLSESFHRRVLVVDADESVRAAFPSPAPLRLRLGVRQNRLSVKILKRRGSGLTPTLWLDTEQNRTAGAAPASRLQPSLAHAGA